MRFRVSDKTKTNMKILVLSDVHGNRFGLEAVLAHGADCDAVLCLGDVVGYGAHPNECCEMLRERGAVCLSGNHDAAVFGGISTEWFNDIAATAVLWTRRQLTPDNLAWLEELPPALDFPEWKCQAVHASLREPWKEYILDDQIALYSFREMIRPILFFGHTHQAVCATLTADREKWRDYLDVDWNDLPTGAEIELSEQELTMINPGSCGQPRDGVPLAKAAIYDVQANSVDIFTAPYDVQAARAAILEAGLPARLGDRLLQGR